MNELKNYVDHLFANYKQTDDTEELKNEILSNLEAKAADYMRDGMTYEESIALATQNLDTVDFLIDGHPQIYINRYRMDLMQTALIYVLLAWIMSIPVTIIRPGLWISVVLPAAAAACLAVYAAMLFVSKRNDNADHIAAIHKETWARAAQAAWILWGVFIIVTALLNTALKFGSNLWFGLPISISGPYQFAVLLIDYALPLLTIIIPLTVSKAARLQDKYEVNSYE